MTQSLDNIEKIITRVNTVWLGEDGIARVIHVPGAEVTLEDAEETMAAYLKLNQGRKRPLLVDTKSMKSIAKGARQYYSGDEAARVASAVAIIIDTPVSRVLGNFYLGLSKPRIPSRLFTTADEALEWLQGYIE